MQAPEQDLKECPILITEATLPSNKMRNVLLLSKPEILHPDTATARVLAEDLALCKWGDSIRVTACHVACSFPS